MGPSTRPYPGGGGPSSDEPGQLEAILSALPAGVLETDLAGRVTYANPAALRILGFTAGELLGRTPAEAGLERYDEAGALVPSGPGPAPLAPRDGDGDGRAVMRHLRPPAIDVWLESRTAPRHSSSGKLVGFVASFVDVTERIRLETTQQSGAEPMQAVLRAMAAGVVLVDADGRIEYANNAAAAASGLRPEDVIGQLVADPAWQLTDENGAILTYDALPVPTALRERREIRGVELGVPRLDGPLSWLRVSVSPLFESDGALRGAVVTTEDVTERHQLAAQLLQAQKLEGIGQLAGGIAHDLNNLLTVILGNADLALELVASDSPLTAPVAEIRDAGHRGGALTRQLLTFARKQVVQPRAVNADQLVAAVENLLRRAVGDDVVLVRTSMADLWPVKVDPGQLEQVLVNMALNARDAMPRGGSLFIETRNCVVDASQAKGHPGVTPGDYVRLSMRDTGDGMSREVIARVFEPFFTTKPTGRGSGLGLSICHGVIKQARGFIVVESELGRGTIFQIHLPRTTDEATDAADALATPLAKGVGKILLVEDEDAVRSYVARALSGYGYEVVSAGTGRLALELCERMAGPLDLLLTDVVMPGVGGLELAKALRERWPTLPVLYMTGYFDAGKVALHELNLETDLLLKPFTPMQLVRRIQLMMAR